MKRMPREEASAARRLGSRRGNASGRVTGSSTTRRDHEQHDRRAVDGLRAEREEQAADRGPADRRDLAGDRAHRERAGQQLGRHELRRQRPAGRVAERGDRAGERRERDELPELVRAAERDDEQEQPDDRASASPRRSRRVMRGSRSASCPAGSASSGTGTNSASPIRPEVERAVVDRVDLPADRDLRHLHREARAEHRRPEAPEVGMQQAGGSENTCRHSAFSGTS